MYFKLTTKFLVFNFDKLLITIFVVILHTKL